MKRMPLIPLLVALAFGCSEITRPVEPDLSQEGQRSAAEVAAKKGKQVERPFKMSRSDLDLTWGIERDQELACGGDEIAGGEISGAGTFTHLGRSTIEMSSAWDIGNLLDPGDVQFDPVGPAGGPVAPVLSEPYSFNVDPFLSPPPPGEPVCEEDAVTATAELVLTAANGDQVFGEVVGGETHRLDFPGPGGVVVPGSGVETFAIIDIAGGTGRFENATGSFVIHTITRFDFETFAFVIDLAELLPDGSIAY